MPSAVVTLPDGRRARLTGPTREAIIAQARQLGGTAAPSEDLGALPPIGGEFAGRPVSEASAPLTLPMGLGQVNVSGTAADAARSASSIPAETSVPIVAATLGSLAVPAGAGAGLAAALPRAATMLGRAAQLPFRGLLGVAPTAAGAGAGGAVAGGTMAAERGASPREIAEAALTTGATMAGAEVAGHGIGALAAKAVAPGLKIFDPLSGARRALNEWMSTLPGSIREGARRVEAMLPERAANAVGALGETAQRATQTIAKLVRQETGDALPLSAKAVADAAEKVSRKLGLSMGDMPPRAWLFSLLREGQKQAVDAIAKLSRKDREVVLESLLDTMQRRASVRRGRELLLDGDRMAALWNEMPASTRSLFSKTTQRAIEGLSGYVSGVQRLGRFARTSIGGEVVEMAATPILAMTFGPGVAVPFMLGKALINPGPLARWLANEKLPNEIVREMALQGVQLETRRTAVELTNE